MKRRRSLTIACVVALSLAAGLWPAAAAPAAAPPAVDPLVWDQIRAEGQARAIIHLRGGADLSAAPALRDWAERGHFVYEQLRAAGRPCLGELYTHLLATGAQPRALCAANAIAATLDASGLRELLTRPEVDRIRLNARVRLSEPPDRTRLRGTAAAVEWNIAKIRADQVWQTFGLRGEGITVGEIDTGVMLEHEALAGQYRGNLGGGQFDHNYHWFDLVFGQPAPYDDHGHGTFAMGVAVGSDGAENQIGVAPGASWIAVKALDNWGSATLEDLHAAMEWMLAPTDLSGQNPDPDKRPHVGLNAWGLWGGCDPELDADLQAWLAAGIVPVFAVGGEGSGCGYVRSPADRAGAFSAGATDSDDVLSGFSARGPSCEGLLKPEVSAPGVDIRSSNNAGGYQVWSGTSWAAAHLAGAAALVLSAHPGLGPEDVASLLEETAVCREELYCGGTPCPDGANNSYGWGRIDTLEAVSLALSRLPAMHVAEIVGRFTVDPYGRPVLRVAVRVHDPDHGPLGNVSVEASLWWPGGGPMERTRYTKPNGWARFPWGSSASGTWQLCVDDLAREGYVYRAEENDVPACAEWHN